MCGEVNYAGFSEDAGEQSSFLQCYGIWGRELYNRNAISSRDDLYSHRSTSGSNSRRRSKFVGKFFINLPLKELSINYTGYIKGPSLRDW